MVDIRVAIEDATRVPALMRRLATVFHRTSISFDRSHKEVRIESEWESRAVAQVVDAVEAWLAETGLGSATLWIGDRPLRLVRSPPLTAGAG